MGEVDCCYLLDKTVVKYLALSKHYKSYSIMSNLFIAYHVYAWFI